MKDVTIKAEATKRELIILASLFGFALLMNIYAIIVYDGAWGEFFSQMHVVLMLAIVLYLITGLIRLIIKGITKLSKGSSESSTS